jgi:hypothetical protein
MPEGGKVQSPTAEAEAAESPKDLLPCLFILYNHKKILYFGIDGKGT